MKHAPPCDEHTVLSPAGHLGGRAHSGLATPNAGPAALPSPAAGEAASAFSVRKFEDEVSEAAKQSNQKKEAPCYKKWHIGDTYDEFAPFLGVIGDRDILLVLDPQNDFLDPAVGPNGPKLPVRFLDGRP